MSNVQRSICMMLALGVSQLWALGVSQLHFKFVLTFWRDSSGPFRATQMFLARQSRGSRMVCTREQLGRLCVGFGRDFFCLQHGHSCPGILDVI